MQKAAAVLRSTLVPEEHLTHSCVTCEVVRFGVRNPVVHGSQERLLFKVETYVPNGQIASYWFKRAVMVVAVALFSIGGIYGLVLVEERYDSLNVFKVLSVFTTAYQPRPVNTCLTLAKLFIAEYRFAPVLPLHPQKYVDPSERNPMVLAPSEKRSTNFALVGGCWLLGG